MDFYNILTHENGETENPYAAKEIDGTWSTWLVGTISIDFLNSNFGAYSTAEEMINATESEGLKLYFARLKEQGLLN